jgi:uncharacterized repeat protein (TIGR01451 family)
VGNVSDGRVRRQLALGAIQLFLLITASLSSGAVARAQDETAPPAPGTPAPAPPALALTTEADKTTFSAVGEVITYTYALTNTGGVALDVSVFGVKLGDVTCEPERLEPGESAFCGGDYITTLDDLRARAVTDRSQGFGTYGGSEEVASNEYILVITYEAPHAGMALEMEADGPTLNPSGEIITYTYTLTNTGGVALDDLSVTDTWVEDVFCGTVHVEPGGSVTCVGAKFITQDDRDNGEVIATAVGHGTYLFGSEEVRSNAASLRIPVATEAPALTLTMNADRATFSRVDEAITVTFELTNTGGVALDVVNVFDDKLGDGFCDTPAPLEPGGSFLCTGTYLVTQADLIEGSVTSNAFGIATYGESGKQGVTSNDASWTVDAGDAEPPALTLTMGADVATFSAVGDEIELSYRLTNTGGVALDSVLVSDSKVGAVVCTPGPLGPDGVVDCTASYSITQADLDAGRLSNVAVGTGTYGGSEYVTSDPASPDITYRAPKPPALTLDLAYDAYSFSRVDEVIAFTYTLTNTGGVTLDVSVSHPEVKDVYCPSETLEPGGSVDCTGSYRITQADLDRGYIDSVVGLGTYGESEMVASDAVGPNITFSPPEPPALTLERIEADRSTFSAVGETITYWYDLRNTGGVALDELSVTGSVNGIDVGDADCESGPLEPDESIECEGDYTITEVDLGTGSVTIFATGHGKTGEGEEVASDMADLTIPAIAP